MAGRFNWTSGKSREWRIWDHGDPEVDEAWKRLLDRSGTLQRHASLGGAIPPEDASYVPAEFLNHGRVPDSVFICQDILDASEDGTLLE